MCIPPPEGERGKSPKAHLLVSPGARGGTRYYVLCSKGSQGFVCGDGMATGVTGTMLFESALSCFMADPSKGWGQKER
jgi:hypothetical protein